MKKLFLTILAGIMALGAVAQGGKFTATGTFKGLGDSATVVVVDAMSQKPIAQQTLTVVDDKVDVVFDLERAGTMFVVRFADGRPDYQVMMSVPAIPGENVVFSGEGYDLTLGGSQLYEDLEEARKIIEHPQNAVTEFMNNLQQQATMGVPQEQLMKKYEEEYPALYKALSDAVISYVEANPDKGASAILLTELDQDTELMEATAAKLSRNVQESAAAGLYKGILAAAKKEREEEARREGMAGSMAPDFTLNDINGQPLALSSLRGKWVVIDFWGSWCGWCIKGIPQMKEYYAKYNSKMEILGVDCNDTVEKWKAAVAKHELPWLHVYWDKDDENCDNPLALYEVRGFPTKVVVDPEGKVAKIIVGEDPAFYEYLDQVLK